ncbi:putative Nop14-like family protein [Rosellinia necatrix]|uniref:Putative Nop14-like family protein n=1 Tax=Rosellinia necatrix TaxID=77044 RepID=A0A1W2TDZ0_ROSNE|nr:putative Nop14-like family protein [Rosellinia necatrix]
MPGSQLMRLKASLREQGLIGPQQSKKQRRKLAQDGKVNTNKRAAALESIREQFNPFDFKHNARGPKFQVTSNRPALGDAAKGITGRPGDAKAIGEERRRQTLLVEMNRRNKTGSIRDQRFGENDASMTYEEKMAQRFIREKQGHKNSMFDLEDDETIDGLTHMGKSLSFPDKDDFEETDLTDPEGSDPGNESADNQRSLKRVRVMDGLEDQEDNDGEGEPERKKTKQEVYKEIIAKSKLHKAERQAQKDADEDLREELDQELSDIKALLFQKNKPQSSTGDEGISNAGSSGKDRMERDYDLRLKQLAMDRRAQPSDKTLTEDEIARRNVEQLSELEAQRQKRMRGEYSSDNDEDEMKDAHDDQPGAEQPGWFDEEEEDDFKLGPGIRTRPTATELGFDDEDDFIVEDDLLASGSDLEPIESDDDDDSSAGEEDGQDDEFTKGLLDETKGRHSAFADITHNETNEIGTCPETLEQLLSISHCLPPEKIPPLIQKVRMSYHPKLASENKTRLASFSRVLVQYLSHLSNTPSPPPFATLETIIRHLHSLAKSFPIDISEEFRSHINDLANRCLSPTLGDIVVLVAAGTIFPPSDAFHPVITPAMLLIARHLGQKIPKSTTDFAQGAFMGSLALQYLKLSQRYCPEFMNFCLNTLTSLAPIKSTKRQGNFPQHEPTSDIRIMGASEFEIKKLNPINCVTPPSSEKEDLSIRVAILYITIRLLDTASQLYASKPAFNESFGPVVLALDHLAEGPCKAHLPAALTDRIAKLQIKLQALLNMSKLARRPLELHHHRPLAIKTAIPKFEDQFDPHRHYDADKDRAEFAKLKAEHKKERKGAMRELRKDANFMAREKLRAKKQKDAAYEKKYKRLVAEIQGEEGREANAYDRERQARKRAAKRQG